MRCKRNCLLQRRAKKRRKNSSIDSHHENFAAFIGDNVVVGGKGKVELQKDMNSFQGFEANDFDVQPLK